MLLGILVMLLVSCNENDLQELQDETLKDVYSQIILRIPDWNKTPIPSPEILDSLQKGLISLPKNRMNGKKRLLMVNDSIKYPVNYSNSESTDHVRDAYLFDHKLYFEDAHTELTSNLSSFWKNHEESDYYFGGKVLISNVFFNENLTSGYFYVDYDCGKLCGERNRVEIELEDNRWVIKNVINLSVS